MCFSQTQFSNCSKRNCRCRESKSGYFLSIHWTSPLSWPSALHQRLRQAGWSQSSLSHGDIFLPSLMLLQWPFVFNWCHISVPIRRMTTCGPNITYEYHLRILLGTCAMCGIIRLQLYDSFVPFSCERVMRLLRSVKFSVLKWFGQVTPGFRSVRRELRQFEVSLGWCDHPCGRRSLQSTSCMVV